MSAISPVQTHPKPYTLTGLANVLQTQWDRLPHSLRGRWPWFLLFFLLLTHMIVNQTGWSRVPTPTQTFHDDDVRIVQYAMVLSGQATGYSLPLVELQPADWAGLTAKDLLSASIENPEDRFNSYKNTAPIWFIASAIVPTALGISPLTVRLGPLLVLALLAVLLYAAGRKVVDKPGGALVAAALLTLIPVGWQGARVGVPTLGNMCAVGLGIWALLQSDAFRKPLWALVAGLLLGTSGRWGESAGDALAVWAALTGPILICAGVALTRLATERKWQDLPGPFIAGGMAVWLVPWKWMKWHTERYVLQEATGSGPSTAGGQSTAPPPTPGSNLDSHSSSSIDFSIVLDNAWYYPEALLWSLLSPAGVVCVLMGGVGLFWIRPRWKVALLLSSVIGSWLVLSLSAKGNDYYAAPMIPALCLIAGLGLNAIPRTGRWLSGLYLTWVTSGWLLHTHKDLPSVGEWSCTTPITAVVAGDPQMCSADWDTPQLYPWFREWRRPANMNQHIRQRFGEWLVHGRARTVLNQLPAGSLVLLVDPHRRAGDVAELLVQGARPDVIVHKTGEPAPRQDSLALDLIESHDHIYALTFSQNPSQANATAQDLPGWLTGVERLADSPDADIWQVNWRQ